VSLNPGLAGLSLTKLDKKICELKKDRRSLPAHKKAGPDLGPAVSTRQKLAELQQEFTLRRLLNCGKRNV